MSQARLHEVPNSRKDQGRCEKCRTALPKGTPYRWFTVGFRSTNKRVRCMEPECTPTRAERESSKLSGVYEAIDTALHDIDGLDDPDAITQAVNEVGSAMSEIAEEYREASTDNNGVVFNITAEERADELDTSADQLENWVHQQNDEPDWCDQHQDGDADGIDEARAGCEDCQEAETEWIEAIRADAREALNDADTL